MSLTTSICVCTWERPKHLTQVFQTIARHARQPYEVVVVDDASKNPEIHALLAHFQGLFQQAGVKFTVHVNEKNMKHAASQNKAWDLASGDVLFHIEDDILVPFDGWNIAFADFLEKNPEVGQVIPHGSGRGEWIPRPGYNEYAWGLGGLFAVRREVFQRVGGWDEHLWHQVEPDYNLRVRMGGWRVAEVPGIGMIHLGEGDAEDTFRRQAQIVVGVHQMLGKWNHRFNGWWDYDSLFSMSWDDFPPNVAFRRQLAAYFAAEAAKLEDRYRGLGILMDDPKYAGSVPDSVRKMHAELKKCEINVTPDPFQFPGHWGQFELTKTIRPRGREREKELITLMKNNHPFKSVRRVEHQLRDLAKRMNYDLSEEELQKYASLVPIDFGWGNRPIYS